MIMRMRSTVKLMMTELLFWISTKKKTGYNMIFLDSEVGNYKRKKESKKKRKKTRSRLRKLSRKKKKFLDKKISIYFTFNLFYFLVFFHKFPPQRLYNRPLSLLRPSVGPTVTLVVWILSFYSSWPNLKDKN